MEYRIKTTCLNNGETLYEAEKKEKFLFWSYWTNVNDGMLVKMWRKESDARNEIEEHKKKMGFKSETIEV